MFFFLALPKRVFIIYGADSYNTIKGKEDQLTQAVRLEELYGYIVDNYVSCTLSPEYILY
jgi:hypothetical protein